MPGSKRRKSHKTGLPPGSLVHIGQERGEAVQIRLMDYDGETLRERQLTRIEEAFAFRHTPTVTWIDIDGLHEVEVVRKIGEEFGIHPLVQEDILNTTQRPKVEDHGSHLYIVARMISCGQDGRAEAEQLSIVVGPNYVITFQEKPGGDVLGSVRERLRHNRGRIRQHGADYLVYALLDTTVDHYFVVLEKLGDQLEELEDLLLEAPEVNVLHSIQQVRRDVLFVRQAAWPLREVVNHLHREVSPLVAQETKLYLRDIYDHLVQMIDMMEVLREVVVGLLDIYLFNLNNRLNEVMKVLALFTAVFIPLTFIVGVYGMNFHHMPELDLSWTYPALWAVMISIGVGMVLFFRKKKWL
ncbi:MAG: magnesium/cobalt transporter CorA [Candidatus Latescibacteria bacterium]|nr:magnesium/cobalt transporter CorA [Candidatus Latescibacterota bacterium]